nr:inositol monophosphatase [uncultured bacterium]
MDRESEGMITEALRRIRPDAIVVGEEATHADPSLAAVLSTPQPAWLLDPLDGTANFVEGSEDFAVMVAFVEGGHTTHAWIWRPIASESWTAALGEGAYRNGERVTVATSPRSHLRGAVLTRFLEPEHRAHIDAHVHELGEVLPGLKCAGVEYPDIITASQDFAMFKRTLPWDHAPGAFILREAGGVARRWDGTDYEPTIEGVGLLATATNATWDNVAVILLTNRSAGLHP